MSRGIIDTLVISGGGAFNTFTLCLKYIIIYFDTRTPLQGPYDLAGSPQPYMDGH